MDRSSDVRQSLAALPAFLQPFFTWLTGAPLPGARPRIRFTPYGRMAAYLATLALGVAGSVLALALSGGWLLLLPGTLLLTSGAMRALYLTIVHHAVHHAVARTPAGNRRIAEVISTLLFVNGYHRLRADHVRWHHGKSLGTLDDPDARTLWNVGFRPGVPRAQNWRTLIRALFSPRFHRGYLKQRFVTNFIAAPRGRAALAGAFLAAQISLVAVTGLWVEWLIAWVLPLTVLYQMSALSQLVAEHHWFQPVLPGEDRGARWTFARHLGDAYPAARVGSLATAWARLRFWLRLAFVHLPARLWILVGSDIHVHDYHHRHPTGDWANAAHARREDAMASRSRRASPYVAHWGSYADHMNVVFDAWAAMDPATGMRKAAA